MSGTLLAIISAPQDNALVARHWDYFKMTGFDMWGIGTMDGKCEWPEPIPRMDNGQMGKKITRGVSAIWGLVNQELEVLEAFINKTDYDACMIVEADNLFVRKPPEHPGHMLYLVNLMTNLHHGLFKTPVYASTPRYCDRETAKHLVHFGRMLVEAGDNEMWISDRFMMNVAISAKLRFQHYPSWTAFPFPWSGMGVREAFIKDARAAIALGNVCLHGVKTEEDLQRITEGFKIL